MLRRFRTWYVSGMSDSPMWKRGNFSRSNSRTLWPCCAMRVETVEPAGPPPMTTTSGCCVADISSLRLLPGAVFLFVGGAGGAEQLAEAAQVAGRQVAELP